MPCSNVGISACANSYSFLKEISKCVHQLAFLQSQGSCEVCLYAYHACGGEHAQMLDSGGLRQVPTYVGILQPVATTTHKLILKYEKHFPKM